MQESIPKTESADLKLEVDVWVLRRAPQALVGTHLSWENRSLRWWRPPPIEVSVFGNTNSGRVRPDNQDRFLVADLTRQVPTLTPDVQDHVVGRRGSLFLVADGMGGAAAGALASEMAVESIYSHLLETRASSSRGFLAQLRSAVEAANAAVHHYASERPEYAGMGTTATVAGILKDEVIVAQIGDSRAYLVRHGLATQVTRDQSLTQQLVDAGKLSPEDAETSNQRNVILQALGPSPEVDVRLTRTKIGAGDILVICSDGLSGPVEPQVIADVVTGTRDPAVACDELIASANARGGRDNITVIVAYIGGEGLHEPGPDETVTVLEVGP